MGKNFDVAVLGLGATGSAAAYHLAKTGKTILAIDKFTPLHPFGSSHGESRIIREAYFESPIYVPLVQQAYQLWHALERESGKKLLLKTGGLMLGNADTAVVKGAKSSADTHHLKYEYLDHTEISQRFPGFKPTPDTVGVFEKNAGILFPEACIKTHLELAKERGVTFQYNEAVAHITGKGDEVEIITDKGRYTAGKVVVSVGSWLGELMPELQLPLSIRRQVLHWFNSENDLTKPRFLPENFPIYIWEYAPNRMFYGFPDLGEGIKIAFHHGGELTTPDGIDRTVSKEEIRQMEELTKRYLNINPTYHHSAVCMYTNTPDEDFIIDYHPAHKNIIIASPCSGHGFKFSSAVGKILCNMAADQPLNADLSFFSISRLMEGKHKP